MLERTSTNVPFVVLEVLLNKVVLIFIIHILLNFIDIEIIFLLRSLFLDRYLRFGFDFFKGFLNIFLEL